jgi:hypothetical protein
MAKFVQSGHPAFNSYSNMLIAEFGKFSPMKNWHPDNQHKGGYYTQHNNIQHDA